MPRKEKNVGMTFQETLYCSKISPINSGQFVTYIYIFSKSFRSRGESFGGKLERRMEYLGEKKGGEKNRAANEIEVMVDS